MTEMLMPQTLQVTMPVVEKSEPSEEHILELEEAVSIAAGKALALHCLIVIESETARANKPTDHCHLIRRLWDTRDGIVKMCLDPSVEVFTPSEIALPE